MTLTFLTWYMELNKKKLHSNASSMGPNIHSEWNESCKLVCEFKQIMKKMLLHSLEIVIHYTMCIYTYKK